MPLTQKILGELTIFNPVDLCCDVLTLGQNIKEQQRTNIIYWSWNWREKTIIVTNIIAMIGFLHLAAVSFLWVGCLEWVEGWADPDWLLGVGSVLLLALVDSRTRSDCFVLLCGSGEHIRRHWGAQAARMEGSSTTCWTSSYVSSRSGRVRTWWHHIGDQGTHIWSMKDVEKR